MQSNFNSRRTVKVSSSSIETVDETYDLRGLNLSVPDVIIPKGETPHTTNARMYARQEGESKVAIRTRKGSRKLSTPVGETANISNTATSTGDAEFTWINWLVEPFTANATGVLTKIELEIKSTVSGTGHAIIEVYTDSAGAPGTLLAQSSIYSNIITSSFQYLPAYFIDAPSIISGTKYWYIVRVQRNGTATYALNKTAAAGGYSAVFPGGSYTALGYTWRYKTYTSTAGNILGFTRRYPELLANRRTLFAMGTNVYSVTDAGIPTSISSAISSSASAVRFAQVDDKTLWVDGLSTAKWWDGTTVSAITGVTGTPSHVIIHQQRSFFVDPSDPTRVFFSDLNNFTSYTSTNFFYVPSPKSPDHISGWRVFQDNLVIFTHETKHILYGSDLSSFTRKEAIGTKGAVSDEAIAVDRNYIYFMADDKQIYRFNGVEDELLSEKVQPALSAISDVSKVRLHIYNNQLRVYFPSGIDTQSKDMLLLELSNKESNKHLQWFRDTNRAVLGSLEWTQDDNQLIEFSSKCGAMYLGETDDSDLGKGIEFSYWTPYKKYVSGSAKTRIRRFRPYVRPSSTPYILNVGKDVDFLNDPQMTEYLVDAGGAKWGNFVFGDGTVFGAGKQLISDKVAMSGRGNQTQYRFSCNEVDAPVELLGYIAIAKSGAVN